MSGDSFNSGFYQIVIRISADDIINLVLPYETPGIIALAVLSRIAI